MTRRHDDQGQERPTRTGGRLETAAATDRRPPDAAARAALRHRHVARLIGGEGMDLQDTEVMANAWR